MIKDFRDANLDITAMSRGTDASHSFIPVLDDGTTFVWDQYTVVCEGRLAWARAAVDFVFATTFDGTGGFPLVIVSFPKTIVTNDIREQKIYWRVLATHNVTGKTVNLKNGEVWLS